MFTVLWTIAFIANGIPHIEQAPDVVRLDSLAECEGYIASRENRMTDYMRGRMGMPLDIPMGVTGACKPVQLPT